MFEFQIPPRPDAIEPQERSTHASFRHLALVGNALPRRCGMATFTSHVADALRQRFPGMKLDHYAMDDGNADVYGPDIHVIDAQSAQAYRDAAAKIEASGADAIWLQHEFGIFGGEAGSMVLELIGATRLPLITTLHTVLDQPSEAEDVVMRRVLDRSDRVIVMGSSGAEILQRRYGVKPKRIALIPHGVPDRPMREPDELKPRFGWQGRKVLMTFGLLAPDKGIRHMIEAMPAIVEAEPDTLYSVVGATHPNVARREGEAHRASLMALAQELGVGEHVRFVNRFVEQEDLLDMLQACDIYITPYLNMAQVTSGTLSYAVAVGKPVIATPYLHAREILADNHGLLVPRGDADALAGAAKELLSNEPRRLALSSAAYQRGRDMLWSKVVEQALAPLRRRAEPRTALPTPSRGELPLDAIQRMTDEVGMMQHAIHSIPNRDHGYCIDDNCRALMVMARREWNRETSRLASTYAAFVQHGWNAERRRFRNFMGFDRRWLEDVGSDDSNGRTIWALGAVAARARDGALRDWALKLFDEAAPAIAELEPPRTRAFAALGGYELLQRHADHDLAKVMLQSSAEQLMRLHARAARDGWDWFEPSLTYDNARLPEALIRAGMALGRPEWVERGLACLGWLEGQQTGPRGTFRPVGCHGLGREYSPPLAFDQQPVEAAASVDAAWAAIEASGDLRWQAMAQQSFGWFFGDNDAGVPLADIEQGACFDGLMATGINRNQGAESILALHQASLAMRASGKQAGQLRSSVSEAGPVAVS
ncbi:MAG TPA: glycosyltransferase family 4 protein [Sphingomicrobium sp.]|nr:glycosyltransferase family 4 protein [Sphingomicrobium sp.]